MLALFDIGNTLVKIGITGKDNFDFFKVEVQNVTLEIFKKYSISDAIISSVVPNSTEIISEFLKNNFNIKPLIVNRDFNFGIKFNYKTFESLGIDRICAAVGARNLVEAEYPVIFIDFGTATTINLIDENSVFQGGMILPGLQTMSNSLYKGTSNLPSVNLNEYISIIGKSTKECISSGILNSTLGALDIFYNEVKKNSSIEPKILITGGNATKIEKFIKYEYQFIRELVLLGLKEIYELNR